MVEPALPGSGGEVERDLVDGVAGGEGRFAIGQQAEADEVRAGDNERGLAGRRDAHDATVAGERGGDVEVVGAIEGEALGAA